MYCNTTLILRLDIFLKICTKNLHIKFNHRRTKSIKRNKSVKILLQKVGPT